MLWRCRQRSRTLSVLPLFLIPLCLGFQIPIANRRHCWYYHESLPGSRFPLGIKEGKEHQDVTQLRATREGDLMEKIEPLIDAVTTAKEIIPSDLTQDYASVVFPEPLSITEVSVVRVRLILDLRDILLVNTSHFGVRRVNDLSS